jgi:signal transduction histidine kinase
MTDGELRNDQPASGRLLLPPLLEALNEWQSERSEGALSKIRSALAVLAEAHAIDALELEVIGPTLVPLRLAVGSTAAEHRIELRSPMGGERFGTLAISGSRDGAHELARALDLALDATWSRVRARRSARHLEALDSAVRGIAGVLDVDRVLQLIVDRVRDLVDAEYAALGIVGEDGSMLERFVTSGISDERRAKIGDLPRGHGLLGLIIRENRSFRIPDIATDRRRHGFPPHHPEMHAFLGVPVAVMGRSVGNLYLTNKRGAAEFSGDDQALVEMFALHAGIAIENARLHARVHRLAVVEERERISKDLHDGIIQSIYAVTLALDDVEEIVDEDRPEAVRRLDRAIDALHGTIRDIRNFIFGLRPVLLEAGGLSTAFETLADDVRLNAGLVVEVSADPSVEFDLPMVATAELLSITREALSNTARHADANRVEVELVGEGDRVRLTIADDGSGFDPAAEVGAEHHGLANMQARAARLGGVMEIASRPGEGTRIIVLVPADGAPPAAEEGTLEGQP